MEIKKVRIHREIKNDPKESCDASILTNPYNGETYFADSNSIPEFKWINHSKQSVKNYVFELYSSENLIFETKVKKSSYKFTKKMASKFYRLKDIQDYRWRITTFYNNCESSSTEYNYFTIQPSSRAQGECDYIFTNISIDCESPAFDADGKVRYSGTFTVQLQQSLLHFSLVTSIKV